MRSRFENLDRGVIEYIDRRNRQTQQSIEGLSQRIEAIAQSMSTRSARRAPRVSPSRRGAPPGAGGSSMKGLPERQLRLHGLPLRPKRLQRRRTELCEEGTGVRRAGVGPTMGDCLARSMSRRSSEASIYSASQAIRERRAPRARARSSLDDSHMIATIECGV